LFHRSKLIEAQINRMKATNLVSGVSSSMPAMNIDKKCLYTDEELIARFQDGDEQAYVELVNRFRDRLITFVYGYFKDIEKAEDIVQDTFVKLYTKKHYYKEIAKFSTWIYTIAGNLAKSEWRKIPRRPISFTQMGSKEREYVLPSVETNSEDKAQGHYAAKQIQKAIGELPLHFRTVIILRDMQGISYEEISKIVDVPLGTVKSRINRARLQLQEPLKEFRKN